MARRLQSRPIGGSAFAPRDDTLLAWLGMAGVLINARGTVVLIDPLISLVRRGGRWISECGRGMKVELPIRAEDVPRADAVLYTHADSDHFTETTAGTLDRLEPLFVAPGPVIDRLQAMGVAPARLRTAGDFDAFEVGTARIEVTPALHDWQESNPWRRGDCCGFVVRTPDGAVWHPGDTRLIDELLDVRGVDVLLFDVAAVNAHLGPAGSARLAETCGAKVMVAYHYGTLDVPPGSFGGCDPADSLPYVQRLAARFLTPDPGEEIRLPRAARGKAP